MNSFIQRYFLNVANLFQLTELIEAQLILLKNKICDCSQAGGCVYILGNGGSAAISSHVSVDLIKNAKIYSRNFNDSSFITCLANDFGHDNWMKEALKFYTSSRDLVILISSSGNSANIINAAQWCLENNRDLVTFSGMSSDNELIKRNDYGLNFWVDSKAYNIIETVHQFWLLCVVDLIIGNDEYPATPKGYVI